MEFVPSSEVRMKLSTDIRIRAMIEVDDKEAEMLEYLCSYDVAKVFAEKFSHKYSKEQIQAVLAGVRDQCRKITAAKEAAVEAADIKLR